MLEKIWLEQFQWIQRTDYKEEQRCYLQVIQYKCQLARTYMAVYLMLLEMQLMAWKIYLKVGVMGCRYTEKHLHLSNSQHQQKYCSLGLKLLILLSHMQRVEKLDCLVELVLVKQCLFKN